ncbi:MAG: iron-containing alcohol dehydrogenase, partial [Victivallales bacterium]|nr:iron-containing alcohol dehydrogenase [Victivallales bacterium]
MLKELPGLNKLFGRNILIVTGGKSLKKSGYYKQIIESLKDFNVYVVNVDSEPSPVIIDTFVLNNLNNNIDVVCAIGGGSALDTGKAVSAMLKEEKFRTVKDYLEGVGSREPSGNKIPFIAVPTTSGTGSEATKNAVISEIGPAGFKKSLRHDNYIPNAAVIDPQL